MLALKQRNMCETDPAKESTVEAFDEKKKPTKKKINSRDPPPPEIVQWTCKMRGSELLQIWIKFV